MSNSAEQRDHSLFPLDENGDALWRMRQNGDNLDIQREINFSVIFPSEDAALNFAVFLLRQGQKVSFSSYEGSQELPWEVTVHPIMLPTHAGITDFEDLLSRDASHWGGRNDGWGCFEQ